MDVRCKTHRKPFPVSPSCGLAVSVAIDNKTATAAATGGTRIYQYRLEGEDQYNFDRVRSNLADGTYTLYVRDLFLPVCEAHVTFTIEPENGIAAVPTNPRLTRMSTASLKLQWDYTGPTPTRFFVERARDSLFTTGTFTTQVSPNLREETMEFSLFTRWYFHVRAESVGGQSDWSQTVNYLLTPPETNTWAGIEDVDLMGITPMKQIVMSFRSPNFSAHNIRIDITDKMTATANPADPTSPTEGWKPYETIAGAGDNTKQTVYINTPDTGPRKIRVLVWGAGKTDSDWQLFTVYYGGTAVVAKPVISGTLVKNATGDGYSAALSWTDATPADALTSYEVLSKGATGDWAVLFPDLRASYMSVPLNGVQEISFKIKRRTSYGEGDYSDPFTLKVADYIPAPEIRQDIGSASYLFVKANSWPATKRLYYEYRLNDGPWKDDLGWITTTSPVELPDTWGIPTHNTIGPPNVYRYRFRGETDRGLSGYSNVVAVYGVGNRTFEPADQTPLGQGGTNYRDRLVVYPANGVEFYKQIHPDDDAKYNWPGLRMKLKVSGYSVSDSLWNDYAPGWYKSAQSEYVNYWVGRFKSDSPNLTWLGKKVWFIDNEPNFHEEPLTNVDFSKYAGKEVLITVVCYHSNLLTNFFNNAHRKEVHQQVIYFPPVQN